LPPKALNSFGDNGQGEIGVPPSWHNFGSDLLAMLLTREQNDICCLNNSAQAISGSFSRHDRERGTGRAASSRPGR
jgi:hypothetical protein